MRYLPMLALPLALAACETGPAGPTGTAPTAGLGWSYSPEPPRAALGAPGAPAEVSVACATTTTGNRAVVWTFDEPARPGTGETMTISTAGLRVTVSMTGVADPQAPGGTWRGSIAPTDPSRQVLSDARGPVTFSLASGASVTAPDAGPALRVYNACI